MSLHEDDGRRTASWSTAQDLPSVVFLEAWRRRKVVEIDDEKRLRRVIAPSTCVPSSTARW